MIRAPEDLGPEPSRLLVVVPAFNEASGIGATLDEIHNAAPQATVLVVDDGSTDTTAAVALQHGARVARLPFNLGIGGAVQTGFRHAADGPFDIAIQIDADGQHVPASIPALLQPLLSGEADVVVGSRFLDVESYRSTRPRLFGIQLLSWLAARLTRCRVRDATSGFRAYNRRAFSLLADNYPTDYPEAEALVLMSRAGLRVREVGVAMRPRVFGRSSIGRFRSIHYMFKVMFAMIISVLRKPLRFREDRPS
ncbi:MAG: glycosyltransferase family 2 protein [Planctomycetota bacterium]